MFVYTLEHIIVGVILLAVVGFYGYHYLHFRYLVWRGRKISERQRADEADKLKEEVDALRIKYPDYSDRTLEDMVRANRLRATVEGIQRHYREDNDNPDVRNQRTKGTIVQNEGRERFKAEGGFNRPLVVTSTPDPLQTVMLAEALNDFNQGYEVTPFVAQEGKGNDTTTGNDSSTRASGHRSDRDDSSGTKEGWFSDRLQGGSGWGSSASHNHGSSRSDSDSRDYGNESDSSSSSPSND